MQPELLAIISRTSQQILESASAAQSQQSNYKQTQLMELLLTVFEQFRRVAAAHKSVLRSLANVSGKYKIDSRFYETPDVWSKIQAVVTDILYM